MNNPLANPKKATAAQAYTTDISQPLTSGKSKPKAAQEEEEKKEEDDSDEDQNDSDQEEESKTASISK